MKPDEEIVRLAHRVRQQRAMRKWAYPPVMIFCILGVGWGFWQAFRNLNAITDAEPAAMNAGSIRGMAVLDTLMFLGPLLMAFTCIVVLIYMLWRLLVPRPDLELLLKMADLEVKKSA